VTDDLGDWSDVTTWLHAHQPADVGQCLIHNDWRFDNMVLDPADRLRVHGVLDWEMATVGDPLMDLGGTMAYWVQDDDDEFFRQFRRQPTNLPGMLSRDEVVAYYCERTGHSVTPEQWQFYEVYGLFRLGVIAQQIYYRYHHGQTTNEAYARFLPMTQYLEQRCNRLIDEATA
jgi:aminoglycoside phosphotransferase (APT) family kinase protein